MNEQDRKRGKHSGGGGGGKQAYLEGSPEEAGGAHCQQPDVEGGLHTGHGGHAPLPLHMHDPHDGAGFGGNSSLAQSDGHFRVQVSPDQAPSRDQKRDDGHDQRNPEHLFVALFSTGDTGVSHSSGSKSPPCQISPRCPFHH